MADTLRKKAALLSITPAHCDIHDEIKDDMQQDPEAKKMMELVTQGKTRCFWVEYNILLSMGQRVYVPKFGSIRRRIIKKSHNTPCVGYADNDVRGR